jgi:glutathione S-transferase
MFFPALDDLSLRLPTSPLPPPLSYDSCSGYDFKLYTMDLSYFSGKLEMYLRFKEISFERIEPNSCEMDTILHHHSGTEQVPQLVDMRSSTISDSQRWLRDTTAIIEYLENDSLIQQKSLPILPSSCPLQLFFQYLFEDYADEFLWRPAMFWRWEPAFDRFVMGYRFYFEFLFSIQRRYSLIPFFLRPFTASLRQWIVSCFGEDCTTPAKKEIVICQYLHLLDILEEILSSQPYLFGNRPTLIDFGFAGPFFRHFSSDFTPRKVMQQRAPAVYEWIARLWNAKSSKFHQISTGFPQKGSLPESWSKLLPLLKDYLKYFSLNRIAHKAGQQFFHWDHQNEVFYVPVVPYRSWCLMKIQQRFHALPTTTQLQVEAILRQYDCWDDFMTGDGEVIENEGGVEPPFVAYPPPLQRKQRHAEKWNYDSVVWRYLVGVSWRWVLRGLMGGGICLLWRWNRR